MLAKGEVSKCNYKQLGLKSYARIEKFEKSRWLEYKY